MPIFSRLTSGRRPTKGDRVAITATLQLRVGFLPWLAAGGAEIDVVVGQHDETAAREKLGIFQDRAFLDPGHAGRHHDGGKRSRRPDRHQQRSAQPRAAGWKRDIAAIEFEVLVVVDDISGTGRGCGHGCSLFEGW
jgi:hypothetical protein